ncbi:MAG: hypothetical protein AAFO69_15750, partial [Bacteroidota bacterium]
TSVWVYGIVAFLSCLVFMLIYQEADFVRVSIMASFSVIPICYTGIFFIRYKQGTTLIKFMGYAYLFTAATHAFRGYSAFQQGADYQYMEGHDTVELAFFIIVNLSFFLGTIGFVMLLNERAENQVLTVNRELEAETKSLQKLNKEQNNFFSIISHDLRGPIGGLMVCLVFW